jgi:hypothetical protein
MRRVACVARAIAQRAATAGEISQRSCRVDRCSDCVTNARPVASVLSRKEMQLANRGWTRQRPHGEGAAIPIQLRGRRGSAPIRWAAEGPVARGSFTEEAALWNYVIASP